MTPTSTKHHVVREAPPFSAPSRLSPMQISRADSDATTANEIRRAQRANQDARPPPSPLMLEAQPPPPVIPPEAPVPFLPTDLGPPQIMPPPPRPPPARQPLRPARDDLVDACDWLVHLPSCSFPRDLPPLAEGLLYTAEGSVLGEVSSCAYRQRRPMDKRVTFRHEWISVGALGSACKPVVRTILAHEHEGEALRLDAAASSHHLIFEKVVLTAVLRWRPHVPDAAGNGPHVEMPHEWKEERLALPVELTAVTNLIGARYAIPAQPKSIVSVPQHAYWATVHLSDDRSRMRLRIDNSHLPCARTPAVCQLRVNPPSSTKQGKLVSLANDMGGNVHGEPRRVHRVGARLVVIVLTIPKVVQSQGGAVGAVGTLIDVHAESHVLGGRHTLRPSAPQHTQWAPFAYDCNPFNSAAQLFDSLGDFCAAVHEHCDDLTRAYLATIDQASAQPLSALPENRWTHLGVRLTNEGALTPVAAREWRGVRRAKHLASKLLHQTDGRVHGSFPSQPLLLTGHRRWARTWLTQLQYFLAVATREAVAAAAGGHATRAKIEAGGVAPMGPAIYTQSIYTHGIPMIPFFIPAVHLAHALANPPAGGPAAVLPWLIERIIGPGVTRTPGGVPRARIRQLLLMSVEMRSIVIIIDANEHSDDEGAHDGGAADGTLGRAADRATDAAANSGKRDGSPLSATIQAYVTDVIVPMGVRVIIATDSIEMPPAWRSFPCYALRPPNLDQQHAAVRALLDGADSHSGVALHALLRGSVGGGRLTHSTSGAEPSASSSAAADMQRDALLRHILSFLTAVDLAHAAAVDTTFARVAARGLSAAWVARYRAPFERVCGGRRVHASALGQLLKLDDEHIDRMMANHLPEPPTNKRLPHHNQPKD